MFEVDQRLLWAWRNRLTMLTVAAPASPERVSGLLVRTVRGAKTCTAACSDDPAVAAAAVAVRNGCCMLKE